MIRVYKIGPRPVQIRSKIYSQRVLGHICINSKNPKDIFPRGFYLSLFADDQYYANLMNPLQIPCS